MTKQPTPCTLCKSRQERRPNPNLLGELLRTPCMRTSENSSYETVRKALEKPASQHSGSPERGISAYFTSPTPAIFTTGVLLVPLFGQSLCETGSKEAPARRCRSLDLASKFGRLRFAALPLSEL